MPAARLAAALWHWHHRPRPRVLHNPPMRPNLPDAELIALLDRVAAKDQAALKALYECTSSRLYGLALRVVGRRDGAEDVL